MKPETSATISGRGYADPCTLVVAMVYLDRIRVKNKVSPSSLIFLSGVRCDSHSEQLIGGNML